MSVIFLKLQLQVGIEETSVIFRLFVLEMPFSEVIAEIESVLQSLRWSEMLSAYIQYSLQSKLPQIEKEKEESGEGEEEEGKEEDSTLPKRRRVERTYRLSVKLRPKFLIRFRQVSLVIFRTPFFTNYGTLSKSPCI